MKLSQQQIKNGYTHANVIKQKQLCSVRINLGLDVDAPKFVICSTCKRKLKVQVTHIEDSHSYAYIPAHKPKGWWKGARKKGRLRRKR